MKLKVPRLNLALGEIGRLARDLSQLTQGGYNAVCARPLDLFPQTWHVETVVALKKEEQTLD